MAIKINGKDLAKRIINGVEVEKVIRNGVQIRPDSPTPSDHIHADFTNYSMPSGWIYGSQNFTYTDKGLLSNETLGSSSVQYRPNWQTPTFDLSNAIKLVSIGKFYLTPIQSGSQDTPYWTWSSNSYWGGLTQNISYGNRIDLRIPGRQIYPRVTMTHTLVEGFYTANIETDLVTGAITYTLNFPNGDQEVLTDTLTSGEINTIKQNTSFLISFRESTIISEVDIYIYY